ncbi:S8 family serine peptidase [Haliovirga abyssi]|uniref:Peptidase S8/S53 domain-containing protein n=1 Tax=Haliovirga abyssi TaxID=2996794 RepID=A0AAU9DBF6_9FUSO|nr:S8 family serine peptidase [Haliovirga abyssi]BDU49448.1 hypothetical protein HLVA_00170 [Haliovirga abyssi]
MKIAIIDSGEPEKSKLNIIKSINVTESVQKDENGHSTAIYKILERYLNEEDEIINIKILNKDLKGSSFELLKALNLLKNEKVDIIGLSLGTTTYKHVYGMHKAINYLIKQNIVVVAAKNNSGKISFPAEFDKVIGVGNSMVDVNEKKCFIDYFNTNIYLNINEELDIENKKIELIGNSYLVPHIVGLTSKILKENSIKDLEELLYILETEKIEELSIENEIL